jgi:hypothetical protein
MESICLIDKFERPNFNFGAPVPLFEPVFSRVLRIDNADLERPPRKQRTIFKATTSILEAGLYI